jgi:hypothetical protein
LKLLRHQQTRLLPEHLEQEGGEPKKSDRLCLQQTESLIKTNEHTLTKYRMVHLDFLHATLDLRADNLALQNLALALSGLQNLLPLHRRHFLLLDALNFFAPLQRFG